MGSEHLRELFVSPHFAGGLDLMAFMVSSNSNDSMIKLVGRKKEYPSTITQDGIND